MLVLFNLVLVVGCLDVDAVDEVKVVDNDVHAVIFLISQMKRGYMTILAVKNW